MKIAIVQNAPEVGKVDENTKKVEKLLEDVQDEITAIGGIDWLVLPELALTGYSFGSRDNIEPFLEPTAAGRSSEWAKIQAKKYNCHVSIGYPETPLDSDSAQDEADKSVRPAYNSSANFDKDGNLLYHYRKTHMFIADVSWATKGSGFFADEIVNPAKSETATLWADKPVLKVAHGICMDLNANPNQPISDLVAPSPYIHPTTIDYSIPPVTFQQSLDTREFGNFCNDQAPDLIVINTAWLASETKLMTSGYYDVATEPDLLTLEYWIDRFLPILKGKSEKPCIVVVSNRCGSEGDVVYCGTSCVFRLQNGEAEVFDLLGSNEERCLIVDLDQKPKFTLTLSGSNNNLT